MAAGWDQHVDMLFCAYFIMSTCLASMLKRQNLLPPTCRHLVLSLSGHVDMFAWIAWSHSSTVIQRLVPTAIFSNQSWSVFCHVSMLERLLPRQHDIVDCFGFALGHVVDYPNSREESCFIIVDYQNFIVDYVSCFFNFFSFLQSRPTCSPLISCLVPYSL